MRILHLTTSFPLQQSSMSGVFIQRLICNFPPEITAVVLTPDCRDSTSVESGNYRLLTFRYAPKRWQILAHEPGGLPVALRSTPWHFLLVPPFFLSMLLHTIWLARKNDVIHAHWNLNGIIAGIAGIVTGRPVVTTIRGEDANRIQTSRFQRYLLRLCLKLSYAVVTISRAIDEQLLAKYPDSADKLHFIPNGVSEVLFSLPVADAKPELIILVLGSLIPRKGVDLILAAAAACKDKAWRIIIAGTGPEEAKLRALSAAQGIEERIFFIGQIEPERVPELLSTAHILIQASYSEGRPNTVLEAMAAAVPVIGSDIDGINELITHEENGLLFPAGDIKTLATQLNRLLNVPELRRQLGQAGRKTLQEQQHLTWPQCAATYAALYEEAVN